MKRVWKSIVTVIAAVFLTSCGGGLGGLGGGGSASGGISAQCTSDFGTNAAAAKLEAFLMATNNFVGTAAEIEASLLNTCRDMGETLGLTAGQMAASGDQNELQATCGAVADKIQAELQDLRVNASLEILIVADPPRCEVSVNAYASCAAECDVNVDPGEVNVQCEGGELRGGCSAECTGSCSVQASAACQGTCEGTCSAGCQGTCNGLCEGTCSATGPDGQCAGQCDGVCKGSCSGGCTGSCQGECVAEVSGSCEGECRGGCSVEFTEPRCTGEVRPPSVSADCQAACDAQLEAEASCSPPSLYVEIRGTIDDQGRIDRIKNALQSGLPAILALRGKLERMANAGQEIARRVRDLPDAVGSLGLQAASCASQAVTAIPRAMTSVNVSVSVSVSVSGSAGV